MAARTIVFQARLTDEEAATMDRRRAELGGQDGALSRSDYIRLLLAADAQRGPDERPQACPVNPLFWHAVVVQIRRIGTNLNQAVASYRRLTREDDRATLILDSSLVNSLRVARESLASLAEECAGVHERAGVKVSHSYARALMRQAAQEAARRWCASDGAGETPLPDFAEAAAAAREAQDAASAALEAMSALRDGA